MFSWFLQVEADLGYPGGKAKIIHKESDIIMAFAINKVRCVCVTETGRGFVMFPEQNLARQYCVKSTYEFLSRYFPLKLKMHNQFPFWNLEETNVTLSTFNVFFFFPSSSSIPHSSVSRLTPMK